jgi:hypothetical protein
MLKRKSAMMFMAVFMVIPIFGLLATSGFPKMEVTVAPFKIYFDRVEKTTDKYVFIYEGTTYVPLRYIAENIGHKVTYDEKTQSIWIGSAPGDKYMTLRKLQPKEIPPSIVMVNNGRLYGEKKYEEGIAFMHTGEVIRYDLEKKYLKLSGVVGPLGEYTNSEESCLVFYGDGREIYRTPMFVAMNGNLKNAPMQIEIDVSNVSILKIEMQGKGTRLGFMEPKLWY